MSNNKSYLKVAFMAALFGVSAFTAQAKIESSLSLGVEVGYDSNVYWYETGPLAERDSVVYTITPKYEAKISGEASDWSTKISYSPKMEFFASESSQDNQKHRLAFDVDGVLGDFDIALHNLVKYINGTGEEDMQRPTGLSPFLGGYIERDRKDALVWSTDYTATKKTEKMLYRAVLEGYYHDFRALQSQVANAGYGYINHIDRSDLNAGFDIGYKAFDEGYVFVGYRFGRMWQGLRPGTDNRYTANYHRLLVGKEGKFLDGKLTTSGVVGVDFRDFKETVAAGFDKDQPILYINGSAKYTVNDDWSVKGAIKRYGLVASTGGSIYELMKGSLFVTNKTTDKLTISAGMSYMEGDWMEDTGVNRTDRLFEPSIKAAYKYSDSVTLNATYSYQDSDLVSSTSEHNRHYFGLGANYQF